MRKFWIRFETAAQLVVLWSFLVFLLSGWYVVIDSWKELKTHNNVMMTVIRAGGFSQGGGVDVPQEAVDEINRRGNMVEHVTGPMGWESAVFGVPPDDSGKWFITIWLDGGQESQALKNDWSRSEWLLAWGRCDDQQRSWSHFNIYHKDNPPQAWREKLYKIGRFPCVIIQPPLSGEYGSPKTIVAQIEGYDGDPVNLSQMIRSAIVNYLRTRQHNGHQQEAEERAPPFQVPADSKAEPPRLVLPAMPQQPPAPVPVESLLLKALGQFLGSTSLQTILLLTLIAVQLWREYRRRNGLPVVLDDASFQRLVETLRKMTGQNNVQS